MKYSIYLKSALLYIFSSILMIFIFQNCSKVKFSQIDSASTSLSLPALNPVCSASQRPLDLEYSACLAPSLLSIRAIQRYSVVCQANGQWVRTVSENIDYSLCGNVCNQSQRPSDIENVSCPGPNASQVKAVQHYQVSCLSNRTWTRSVVGAADFALCPVSCDPNAKPSLISAEFCPAPFASIKSGVQNYTVTCSANGSWIKTATGAVDFGSCPQSCNPATRPVSSQNAKCLSTSDVLAVQNYSVTCNSNGTWSQTPTTFDTAACPSPTCNQSTKPPTSEAVFCPVPFATTKSAVQYYQVTCSGVNWVQASTTRDNAACPKNCATNAPADNSVKVSCQIPFAATFLAVQSYSFSCNNTTGSYQQVPVGAVDYSACPKSCPGPPPANKTPVSCPLSAPAGTAFQNYDVKCNLATGAYTSTPTNIDLSGCQQAACAGVVPANFDSAACPAPFSNQPLAKRMYSVSCVNGSYTRTLTGATDTAACPTNDCTGTNNPGTEKYVGACPTAASGNVFQTCSLQCSGNTYSQVNCSANNYSRCDCGANAVFNVMLQRCDVINCPSGQQLSGNSCAPIVCSTGQQLSGNSCLPILCPNGQRLSGNTCESISCPTGQQLVVNNCQQILCSTGQQIVGSACIPITCSTGQQLSGNSCVPIVCPSGQQLSGSSCVSIVCPVGQTLSGNSCRTNVCSGGTNSMQSRSNNIGTVNTCTFAWPDTQYNLANPDFISTFFGTNSNGGHVTANCTSSGTWGNVNWYCPQPADVYVPPACAPPNSINPSTGQCEQECLPTPSGTKCTLYEVCENGQYAGGEGQQTHASYLNIRAWPNQQIQIASSLISFNDPTVSLVTWDSALTFSCGPSGQWHQVNDGNCVLRRLIPNTNPRCQPIDNSNNGGGS